MKPLVSVVMTTYNGKDRIIEAIQSIFNQTYKNIEIIIVDDASTNDVKKKIDIFNSKHDNIIYIRNTSNLGIPKSANVGLKNSHGKYIARIDDDDIRSDIHKLEKQIEFLENNPDYGMCGCGETTIINGNGKILNKIKARLSDQDIREHILQSNQFVHSSVVIRRDVFDNIGFYNEKFKVALDYELWCRIGTAYKFANIEGISVTYRMNSFNISTKKHRLQYKNTWKIFLANRRNYHNFWRALILRLGEFIMPQKFTNYIIHLLKSI